VTVRTNDAFYGASDFEGVMQNNQKLGVLSFEMECSAIFTVAGLRKGGYGQVRF
jgi:uridine phosphorylase